MVYSCLLLSQKTIFHVENWGSKVYFKSTLNRGFLTNLALFVKYSLFSCFFNGASSAMLWLHWWWCFLGSIRLMSLPPNLCGCCVDGIGGTSSVNESGKVNCCWSVVVEEGVVVVCSVGGEGTVESGGSSRKLIVVGDTGDSSRSDGDNGSISKSYSRLSLGLSSSRFGRSNIESKC